MDKHQLKLRMDAAPDAKLRDIVAELLYEDIIDLRVAPGTKLNVNQIAASLGISRTPVAEAISKLTDQGFVVTYPGQSGSYVLNLDLNDMISLYKARDAIECEAAAQCAHRADDATVLELTKLAEAFKDSVIRYDIRGMKDTDMPFHRLLIDTCENPYLVKSYEVLLPKLTMYQSSILEFMVLMDNKENPWLPGIKYDHISVASAIRLRMPALARQAMLDHVSASLNFTTLSGKGVDPFHNLRSKKTE